MICMTNQDLYALIALIMYKHHFFFNPILTERRVITSVLYLMSVLAATKTVVDIQGSAMISFSM